MASAVRIVVTGDLIIDSYLVRPPRTPSTYHQALPHTALKQRDGGAWYLADMIRLACPEAQFHVEGPDALASACNTEDESVAHAYSVWSPYARVSGSKDRVWRISDFLGCQPAKYPHQPSYSNKAEGEPDLVVIDDENLGFRDKEALWPDALSNYNKPTRIILKAAPPLSANILWRNLVEKYADRLAVVVSAESLRGRNAAISKGLSWDRCIEDLDREFKTGLSARDLALANRVLVNFPEAGVASYVYGRLERFFFHPDEMEGSWEASRPGRTFGSLSILTAAVARYTVDPINYPLFVAAGRALTAVRASHDLGGGFVKDAGIKGMLGSFEPDFAHKKGSEEEEKKRKSPAHVKIAEIFHPFDKSKAGPECEFRAAFPQSLLSFPAFSDGVELKSDLLQDMTGVGYEYMAAIAMEVVINGIDKALASTPKARFGAYVTVDREEIERINEIARLITNYQANQLDRKPLSIAVFGPPGSGKSFAIKQLAAKIFPKDQTTLEFNLSQLSSRQELHQAFHQVRDASVKGMVPLVFWDEFDTRRENNELGWLKEFLAPMQDAEFHDGSHSHPFGKAIFVFAGGTKQSFQEFDLSTAKEKQFIDAKGPDFVSRLRGYVNIKGPNPIGPHDSREKNAELDKAYVLRRAMLLRKVLERFHPELIDLDTGNAAMSSNLIRGFLRVKGFKHGARSLESIVSMCSLKGTEYFGVAALPSPDILKLHVTSDFMEEVEAGEIEVPSVEAIAEEFHKAWRKQKEEDGYELGPERSDEPPKRHPLLIPYLELSEKDKDGNRRPARGTIAGLRRLGYDIVLLANVPEKKGIITEFLGPHMVRMMEMEHDIWLRDYLMRGYAHSETTNDKLCLHRCCEHMSKVDPDDKELDRVIVESIPKALEKIGYALIRK
jgi:hypothetical protein